ncbi:MAG: YfhO family protein, partial [Ardenticatenaceae bacterium]|nr:YfhO family protein [Ardenticatenaceae bacterium]
YTPTFTATALAFVSEGEPGRVEVYTQAGDVWELAAFAAGSGVVRAGWPASATMRQIAEQAAPARLILHGPEQGVWQIHGATLINEADGTFQPLVLGNYRLIHSGDVKIYENLDVLPRAFLLPSWAWQPEQTAVLPAMQTPEFDVRETAVFLGSGEDHKGDFDPDATATIARYEPEQVVVQTSSSQPQALLLSDASYPGWQVLVDGKPAELLQADGLFRGVLLPAGEHEVVFQFAPQSFRLGLMITAVGLGLLALLGFALLLLLRLDARR